MQLENSRIVVDIETMEQARRVEEAIETGYVGAIMESMVNWIGVEEDLAESYEKFSKSLPSSEEREAANKLQMLSNSHADMLRKKLAELEGLQNDCKKRIRLLKKLTKNP